MHPRRWLNKLTEACSPPRSHVGAAPPSGKMSRGGLRPPIYHRPDPTGMAGSPATTRSSGGPSESGGRPVTPPWRSRCTYLARPRHQRSRRPANLAAGREGQRRVPGSWRGESDRRTPRGLGPRRCSEPHPGAQHAAPRVHPTRKAPSSRTPGPPSRTRRGSRITIARAGTQCAAECRYTVVAGGGCYCRWVLQVRTCARNSLDPECHHVTNGCALDGDAVRGTVWSYNNYFR
ncbi:hypothetical protein MTO96_016241 [Rhipicephalus appendiculatus]